jgi:hypothetical protein
MVGQRADQDAVRRACHVQPPWPFLGLSFFACLGASGVESGNNYYDLLVETRGINRDS